MDTIADAIPQGALDPQHLMNSYAGEAQTPIKQSNQSSKSYGNKEAFNEYGKYDLFNKKDLIPSTPFPFNALKESVNVDPEATAIIIPPHAPYADVQKMEIMREVSNKASKIRVLTQKVGIPDILGMFIPSFKGITEVTTPWGKYTAMSPKVVKLVYPDNLATEYLNALKPKFFNGVQGSGKPYSPGVINLYVAGLKTLFADKDNKKICKNFIIWLPKPVIKTSDIVYKDDAYKVDQALLDKGEVDLYWQTIRVQNLLFFLLYVADRLGMNIVNLRSENASVALKDIFK